MKRRMGSVPRQSGQRGVTLIELIVAISLFAILVAIAIPDFQALLRSHQRRTQVNDLVTALHLAKSEAVRRGQAVTICPSSDGTTCAGSAWDVGWVVFTEQSSGKTLLAVHAQLGGSSALAGPDTIVFRSNGLPGEAASFTLSQGGTNYYVIDVNLVGRIASRRL